MTVHRLSVDDPWAEYIQSGQKTIEGRLNKEKYKYFEVNDLIFWNNKFHSKIKAIRHYPSFFSFLSTEKLEQCLPGVQSVAEGVNDVYYKYYLEEEEKKYGVLCIELTSEPEIV